MTATEFTTQALGWIAAAGTIITAAGLAYFKLKAQFQSQIDDLNAKHNLNAGRIDQHDSLQHVVTTETTAVGVGLDGQAISARGLSDPPLPGRLVGYPQAALVDAQTESWAGTSSSLPPGLYALAPDGTKTPLPDPQAFRQPLGQPGAGE